MKKISAALAVVLFLLIAAHPLSAEFIYAPPAQGLSGLPDFQYANADLWNYLRSGLNFLESPRPLLPPESVPPDYVHPDGRGFGAYGLSPEAYEDIQRLYPFFRDYRWDQILCSPKMYDLANQAFADWLLKNLREYLPAQPTKQEVFDVLHQAWNLGLSGFKNGRKVVASRTRRAEEFKFLRPR